MNKTVLENRETVYKLLENIANGYEKGDFSEVFPYLSENCILESQWVLTPNIGYKAVTEYLTGKGNTLRKTKTFPQCSIMELVGNLNPIKNAEININGEAKIGSFGLYYEPCELCLLMEQKKEDETIEVILRIQIDENEKIMRIDLCDPKLFHYRCFFTFVDFYPVADGKEIENGMFRICESYYPELYLFLSFAGIEFDEYDDLNIPMDKWIACVDSWKDFYEYDKFDEAFEKYCGIDYGKFKAKDQKALDMLSINGKNIWFNKEHNKRLIYDIVEWTEKYKDICSSVNTYGF